VTVFTSAAVPLATICTASFAASPPLYVMVKGPPLPVVGVTVTTEFGDVRVKEGRFNGRRIALAPEYEDCRRLAREREVPFQDVYRAAVAAARSSGLESTSR